MMELQHGGILAEEPFEPLVLAFCCYWCAYTGVDLAGPSRLQYLDNVAFENDVNTASYRDSREADWHSATGGHGHLSPIHGGYHAIPPKDQIYNLRTEIRMLLEAMGIK
jgi:hypothetical protein